ncbi:carbohydrate ABC transporter substrate-binding protein [Actinomadura barringtoniae]|uniref:Carbohydrate ABC transporter substrate-binding protein n=1 Tax=Actinomadura barringtoniae TaxID=1427535 RepID=A0A939P6K3_9ACTN|nr:ABC transporter substrate-binding protein [Actinomadura barringtoniae]MBO2446323.1 carbohydrate ABC transporter substrate-binding protein [Actinomadura barringtoniae]
MTAAGTAAATALALGLTACGGTGGGSKDSSVVPVPTDPATVTGSITVLTNRTDQVQDGTLKGYAAAFNKIYPKVKVEFQGLTDYEGDVKIRMNSKDYGDVLSIPNAVPTSQYPSFFSPLGTAGELSKKYDFTEKATVGGKVYGISNIETANGFVYNKAVWKQAGITAWPTTTAAFLDDLKAIKARTGATPYYTNYKDGWPMTNWGNALGSPSCDSTANDKLVSTKEPWAAGQDLNVVDTLLHDIVHDKLSEADPNTTNWENSKNLIGTGKIATMWLGSWAVVQMREAAQKAGRNPDDIGFMPFPQQVNGAFCTVVRPDYQYAINAHSNAKPAARAWIDWYINKSGDAQKSLSISSVKGTPLPSSLQPFKDQGVRFIQLSYAKNTQVNDIDKASEVGLNAQDYPQRIVDVARGAAKGNLQDVFKDLNGKWSEAQGTIGG